MEISVVISYCNNDFRFIEENIAQAKKISKDIIVVSCDYSFDGQPEDYETLRAMWRICHKADCKLVKIPFEPGKHNKYHHNLMRYKGVETASKDWILFLDADEIIEGDLFNEFLNSTHFEYRRVYDVISFKCYWYFREQCFRAKQTEEAAVLIKKSICTMDYIFSNAERWEFFNRPDINACYGLEFNTRIMVHHYSWVRTKEEMLKKVRSWGHKDERNWEQLIEDEFSHEFQMKDFVHGYDFEKV